nr:hypothetical protein [Umezawaea beigongshangensis]
MFQDSSTGATFPARWKATAPGLVPVTAPDGRALRVPRRIVAAHRRGLL